MSQAGIINQSGGSAPPLETLTPNSGGAVSPVANNINVVGLAANAGANAFPIFSYNGGAGQFNMENRAYLTPYVVDQSSTNGSKGTFTTIQAAITQAASDGVSTTIYIRPGTYTEDLTMQPGINLTSFLGDEDGFNGTALVNIIGKMTINFSGACTVSGIWLQTNGDFILSVLGGTPIVTLIDCELVSTNANIINHTSGTVFLVNCESSLAPGFAFFSLNGSSSPVLYILYSTLFSSSSIPSTCSSGFVKILGSEIQFAISTSGLSQTDFKYSDFGVVSTFNELTIGGTGQTNQMIGCNVQSGSGIPISIGLGATFVVSNTTINSTAPNAITGPGTSKYGNLVFSGSSTTINSSGQIPLVSSNDSVSVKTPSAYPYTTIPQDNLILVDTTSARTIVPLASPATGQVHRIKDNVGSAAANNITITPSGKNIDGAASATISQNYGSIDIIYNGTQWNIL